MINEQTTAPASNVFGSVYRFLNQADRLWLTRPLLIFLATRLLLVASGLFSVAAIPADPYPIRWDATPDNAIVGMWARWDGAWYLGISRDGYFYTPGEQSSVAFFPLYPMLISAAMNFTAERVSAGLLVSNLSFLAALILLYQLAYMELKDRDAATRTIFYIALFPTALFFSSVYTEGLFLLLCVATFYFARKRMWSDAAIVGFLCSATRILGVLMWIIVGMEWLWAHGVQLRTLHRRDSWQRLWQTMRADWRNVAAICLIPAGLVAYMLFLWLNFGNPLAFLAAQQEWHNNFIGPIAVISTTVAGIANNAYFWGEPPIIDLVAFFVFLAISIAVWRRLGPSYGLFSLLCILIPISSTTHSMIRYVVVVFPVFMMLGLWGKNKWLHWFLMIAFSILLSIFMITYVSWRFAG